MFSVTNQKRGASELPGDRPVAYFCAEYAISDILPVYSGGLGVLAGDIVQEAAERKLPFIAFGLFYQYGYFHQHIDCSGQNEYVERINPQDAHLELLKDAKGDTLLIEVPVQEHTVYVQVWRFPVGQNSLYLLDTDHWKNSESDRRITDQLYGGDQAKRIQQELVLGIGGFRTLQALGISPSVYHMNEGHSAFLALEVIRDHLGKETGDVGQAIELSKKQLVFTNHTLVPAGNDAFPHELIRYYLGKYAYDAGIGIETVLSLGTSPEQPGKFSMTILAMRMAAISNAVSKLHAKKALDLWPQYRLKGITNGVHLPAWVAPEWQQLWNEKIPEWRENTADPKVWKPVRKLSDESMWEVHQLLKGRMLDEVYARTGIRLEYDALTVVWARRFAAYKRPDLLFRDLDRLKKLLFSADKPIQIIVAGKSHPADGQGKQIIEHIEYLSNYELKHRAVFVDDYSISLSKFLVAGADLWLNTPIFGLEASGTSGMKASANGVLQFTVPDGWAYEVDWYGLGFALPADRAESQIYDLFEKKVIPSYYRRNTHGIPELWTTMMKETIATVSPTFSSTRLVRDYVNELYLPLIPR